MHRVAYCCVFTGFCRIVCVRLVSKFYCLLHIIIVVFNLITQEKLALRRKERLPANNVCRLTLKFWQTLKCEKLLSQNLCSNRLVQYLGYFVLIERLLFQE